MHFEETQWHFSVAANFVGWLGACPWNTFVQLWHESTAQQCPRHDMGTGVDVLEALVIVLCTLRESDYRSLTVAAEAITKLR